MRADNGRPCGTGGKPHPSRPCGRATFPKGEGLKLCHCLQRPTTWQVFPKGKTEPLARPQATAAVRRHPIRGALRRIKSSSFAGRFDTPTQPPWAASFGYQKPVSTEPAFEYRGLLKPPISIYFSIFAISSATNWTLVPTMTCTVVLDGRITPATPADLIFFSSTAV